jgi:primosomal protein N' (replication factor Y)
MLLRVAVPVPTLDLLTYSVPQDFPVPVAGARVVVPLGSRAVTGIVVEVGVAPGNVDAADVKPIRRLLDEEPFVPPDVVSLARWTAEYYAAGAGTALLAALPPKSRGERADSHKTRRVVDITAAGLDALDQGSAKRREALTIISGSAGGVATTVLASRGIGAALVARLARDGLIAIRRERVERDPFESSSTIAANRDRWPLTAEQQEALTHLNALAASGDFAAVLLHGVTGSGKTEVYLRLSAAVRDAGRRVLMLVPEIALTPAMAAGFRSMFGDRVAIQHSALSAGERHDQWQRIRRGEIDVVVGTRSAVFAPLRNVGLIIVDEEHDPSYKQDETPRYNGRDVALVRARQSRALALLGSATPSMETYHNAATGKYVHLTLARRVLDRPLADVRVVDMREEYAASGPDVVLSRALGDALVQRVERREQVVVLLNRRGFATSVFCRQCGGTVDCPNCSVSLVVHGQGASRRARCHYCNHAARVPAACPDCAAPYLDQAGFGTERVEEEVRRRCPAARVARLDRDAIRRKGSLASTLARFRRGEIDVLVGTQMIAKGHDFPRVTLVGVVSADVGLGMADFRASERTFQLITQVAGRAGRGADPGEAIVQTIYPDHYSIQLACRQDYPAFYVRELAFRQAMRYPPHVALLNVVVRGRSLGAAMDDAASLVERMKKRDPDRRSYRVLGPAPAPLARIRGEYRAQFLVKGTQRKRMREAVLASLDERPEIARRTTVDVDPVNVV